MGGFWWCFVCFCAFVLFLLFVLGLLLFFASFFVAIVFEFLYVLLLGFCLLLKKCFVFIHT